MVDRAQRDLGVRLLRELLEGRITNDEFHSQFPRSGSDRALDAIFVFAWGLYSDLHAHKLTGKHEPDADARAIATRCVLFLEGNLEFEWPAPSIGLLNVPRNAWGAIKRLLHAGRENCAGSAESGDEDVWPFFRRGEYEANLAAGPRL